MHRFKHSSFRQSLPHSGPNSLRDSRFFFVFTVSLQNPFIHSSDVSLNNVSKNFIHHKSLVIVKFTNKSQTLLACVTHFISHTLNFSAILVRSRNSAIIYGGTQMTQTIIRGILICFASRMVPWAGISNIIRISINSFSIWWGAITSFAFVVKRTDWKNEVLHRDIKSAFEKNLIHREE